MLAKIASFFTGNRTGLAGALIFLLFLSVIRLLVASAYPLVPDEAYYWVWSLRPSLGYFDHPPMIAWVILVGRSLLGNTELGVRLLPVLMSGATAFFVYLTVKELAGPNKAFHALLAGSAAIIFGVGSVLAVVDVPMLFFFGLGMLAGVKALEKPWWWLVFGVALAGALYSKYTGVFLLVLPLSYVFTARKSVLNPMFLLGLVLAAGLALPHLIWLYQNNWISLGFQAQHGFSGQLNPNMLLKYLGDVLAVMSGLLGLLLMVGAARALLPGQNPGITALAWCWWVVFLFFAAASLKGSFEANWPGPGYLALIAAGTAAWKNPGSWLWKTGLAIGFAAVGLIYAHAVRPFLPIKPDATEQARGWRELATCLEGIRQAHPGVPLASPRYQVSSQLMFYLPDHPWVWVINPQGRKSQFTLWQEAHRSLGERFIYVGGLPRNTFKHASLLMKCQGVRIYNIYLVEAR